MTREEAITALGDRNNLLWGMSKEEQKYYSEALDMAISALSENKGEDRPQGHWIRVIDKSGHYVWECDKCGWQQKFHTNYCPD